MKRAEWMARYALALTCAWMAVVLFLALCAAEHEHLAQTREIVSLKDTIAWQQRFRAPAPTLEAAP